MRFPLLLSYSPTRPRAAAWGHAALPNRPCGRASRPRRAAARPGNPTVARRDASPYHAAVRRNENMLRTKSWIPGRSKPGTTARAIQGRGARSGRERRSESWLGAQTPPRPHDEADADAGRRETTAPRRPRAADASQAASAISVFAPAPDRAHADRARENHRESAADSRKQARRPAQGARTAKRQGVTAISRLPNPRDARRNARIAPSRRAPGIGRTSRLVPSA